MKRYSILVCILLLLLTLCGCREKFPDDFGWQPVTDAPLDTALPYEQAETQELPVRVMQIDDEEIEWEEIDTLDIAPPNTEGDYYFYLVSWEPCFPAGKWMEWYPVYYQFDAVGNFVLTDLETILAACETKGYVPAYVAVYPDALRYQSGEQELTGFYLVVRDGQQELAVPLVEPAGQFLTLPFETFCDKIVELARFNEKYSYSGAVPLQ